MVTVVSALDAVTVNDGMELRPLTVRALSEPLLVTPVTPAISVASSEVAVTALTLTFSIEEPTTPAPYAAVVEVLERVSVSDPAPPVRLSPAFSVLTRAPATSADVAEKVSPLAPADKMFNPVVRACTVPTAAATGAGANAVSAAAFAVATVVASEVTTAGISHSAAASLVIVW
jgi:hypothetical protein